MDSFKVEAQGLFNDKTIAELGRILGLSDPTALSSLQTDLVELCAHYRTVISTLPCDLPSAPFNLSLTKRADWLEANVIKPCERLRAAVGKDMQPMFSIWPYPLTVQEFPKRSKLQSELETLLAEATQLRDSLRWQQSEDAGHSQELRQEIFNAIAKTLRRHRPELKASRGVYDRELRRRVGVYPEAMRLIFEKVTGVKENLDRLIRGEIALPS